MMLFIDTLRLFSRVQVQIYLLVWNLFYCSQISLNVVPNGSIKNEWSSIGSERGLAPNRWQAIIWSDDGLVYWPIHASSDLDVLRRISIIHLKMTHTDLYMNHVVETRIWHIFLSCDIVWYNHSHDDETEIWYNGTR